MYIKLHMFCIGKNITLIISSHLHIATVNTLVAVFYGWNHGFLKNHLSGETVVLSITRYYSMKHQPIRITHSPRSWCILNSRFYIWYLANVPHWNCTLCFISGKSKVWPGGLFFIGPQDILLRWKMLTWYIFIQLTSISTCRVWQI